MIHINRCDGNHELRGEEEAVTCKTCKSFDKTKNDDSEGMCRRYPPKMVCRMGNYVESHFPKVYGRERCGEWSDKP